MMDIGNGQQLITVDPYQTVEIPERCEHALPQMAPQLKRKIPSDLMPNEKERLDYLENMEKFLEYDYEPELELQIVESFQPVEPEFQPEFVEKPAKKTRKKRTTKPKTKAS